MTIFWSFVWCVCVCVLLFERRAYMQHSIIKSQGLIYKMLYPVLHIFKFCY